MPRAQFRNVLRSVMVLLDRFQISTAGPARPPAGATMLRNTLSRITQFAPVWTSTPLV